jgi:hypothetical protein
MTATNGQTGHSKSRIWILALACLILGGGLFGLGYWQGHRVSASQEISSQHESNSSRFSDALATPHPPIPVNASPEMKEFLKNQATLSDRMDLLRSEGPNGTLSPQMFAQFRMENAGLLTRQSQLAQIIGQQQARNTLAAPPALQIPPKASPQLKTYLQLAVRACNCDCSDRCPCQ